MVSGVLIGMSDALSAKVPSQAARPAAGKTTRK
jgi:hypothetical protein